MTEVLEYAARLSQVIGARPGGTEEEQQASFIIEETFKSNGLETSVEEFNCNPNYELPRIICCIVSIVLAVLAIFLPLMLVPAIIVCAAMAALFVMEVVGISPLNNMAKRGISQNVLAKYIPGEVGLDAESTGSLSPAPDAIDVDASPDEVEAAEAGMRTRTRSRGRDKGARKRKIVVMARYDSGRVCRELNPPIFGALTIIRWVEMVGIALIPVVILLRTLTNAEGGLLVFWNVLIALGAVCAFLPVLGYILHQTAPFTDGANNNASGVAVMMEVARRLVEGSREAASLAEQAGELMAEGEAVDGQPQDSGIVPTMHGEDAARQAGVLPVDTDLVYHEAAEGVDPESVVPGEAERAKRLVAEGVVPASRPAGLVGVAVAGAAGAVATGASGAPGAPGTQVSSAMAPNNASIPAAPAILDRPDEQDPNVPEWFRKGLKAAKANAEASGISAQPHDASIHRSRFADALDAAAVASAHSIEEFEAREADKANAAAAAAGRQASGVDEDRLRQMRDNIMGSNMAAKAEVAAVAAEIAASEAEAAKKAAEEAAQKEQAKAARVAVLTPEDAVNKAGSTLQADVAAAIGAQQAEQAAAAAQAVEEVAEQAAVADRTISYIPVAADIPAEISASDITDVSVVDTVGKSAADILEEASAIASDGDAGGKKPEGSRKKRTIALPSLTGAIEGAKVKHQDAPLADDAERKDGEKREALKSAGRRVRSSLASLPSTDLPPKNAKPEGADAGSEAAGVAVAAESVSATVVASREGSTTSFLATAEKEDAKAALSSLDAPVSAPLPKVSGAPSDSGSGAAVSVSSVGAFAVASSTSQFEPVGDELIANVVEEDIIIHDADDSDYTENITHTGAMAGPGYVEMPKSRASRLRGIFSRKKKRENDSISFSEAVGIDEDFDAREVGAARGGWESFQNESADYDAASASAAPAIDGRASSRRSHVDEYSTNSRSLRRRSEEWEGDAWDDDWNGGAFSTLRDRIAGDDGNPGRSGSSGRSGNQGRSAREGGSRQARSSADRSPRGNRSSRRGPQADAPRTQRRRSLDDVADHGEGEGGSRAIDAGDMLEEREHIRSFRTSSAPLASFGEVAAYASAFSNLSDDASMTGEVDLTQDPQPHGFQTEVWFVALGAELADNAGIKSFMSQHSDDLRGTIFIDLDAMGAGSLSLIDEEGVIRRVKASSRMKRYVTKAGTSLGLHINSTKMIWRESAAYYTNRRGLQTIHVAGMKDGKPAYLGEADDKFENLSEEKLLENTAFVLELLNNI